MVTGSQHVLVEEGVLFCKEVEMQNKSEARQDRRAGGQSFKTLSSSLMHSCLFLKSKAVGRSFYKTWNIKEHLEKSRLDPRLLLKLYNKVGRGTVGVLQARFHTTTGTKSRQICLRPE